MKLILIFCLVWTVLHTAETLQCLSCANLLDPNCANTSSSTCSGDQMCLTATVNAPVIGGFNASGVKKACVPSSLCAAAPEASLNLGFGRIAVALNCCKTDNCNSNNLPAPSAVPSGLQCASCQALTSLSNGFTCQSTTPCYGQEATCFNGSLSINSAGYTGLGCASPSTCAAVSLLPAITGLQNFAASISCCLGNLCNKQNPSTTAIPSTAATAPTTASTQNPSTAATSPATATTQKPSTAANVPTTATTHSPTTAATAPTTATTQKPSTAATAPTAPTTASTQKPLTAATAPTTVNTNSAATRLLAAGIKAFGPLLLITFILF